MKKMISLILALVMVLGLAVSASAATVTITAPDTNGDISQTASLSACGMFITPM